MGAGVEGGLHVWRQAVRTPPCGRYRCAAAASSPLPRCCSRLGPAALSGDSALKNVQKDRLGARALPLRPRPLQKARGARSFKPPPCPVHSDSHTETLLPASPRVVSASTTSSATSLRVPPTNLSPSPRPIIPMATTAEAPMEVEVPPAGGNVETFAFQAEINQLLSLIM